MMLARLKSWSFAIVLIAVCIGGAIAQTRLLINQLGSGASLGGTELIPMYQGGNPAVTTTPSALAAYVMTAVAGTGLAVGGGKLNLQPAQPSTIGGVESITCSAHQYINQISGLGVPSCAQPGFSDLSGSLASSQCPNATSATTGCISLGKNSWAGAQRGTPNNTALSTSTFTPNFDTAQNFEFDLTSACPCTLANPSTTLVPGQTGIIEFHQDGSGSRTIGTWGSEYVFSGGTSTIVLSTTASAVDYFGYYVNNAGTSIVLGAPVKGPSH